MGLQQIDGGSGDVVSLALVKAQLGIESADWDALLIAYLAAAAAHVENFTGQALGAQRWKLTLAAFADRMELPKGPVTALVSVKYLDSDRVERTLASTGYIADLIGQPQAVVRDPDAVWPLTDTVPNAVTITFDTGYASAPAPLVQAILLAVATWWHNREAGDFPAAAMALLRPYKPMRI